MTVMPPEAPDLEVVDPTLADERPCHLGPDDAATWLARVASLWCVHVPPVVFMCEKHRAWILAELEVPGNYVCCLTCGEPAIITSWERL